MSFALGRVRLGCVVRSQFRPSSPASSRWSVFHSTRRWLASGRPAPPRELPCRLDPSRWPPYVFVTRAQKVSRVAATAATTTVLAVGLVTTQFFWPWRAAEWRRSPNDVKDASASDLLRQSASGDLYTTIDASYRTNFSDGRVAVQHICGAPGRLYYESEFWQRMTRCADADDSKRDVVMPPATTSVSIAPGIDAAAFKRAWFMCRDDRGSYHMTVPLETANALEAAERLTKQRAAASAMAAKNAAATAAAVAKKTGEAETLRASQWPAFDREFHDNARNVRDAIRGCGR